MFKMKFETFCTTPVISRSALSCCASFRSHPAAGLQIVLMRRSIHRRDIDDLEPAGLPEFLPDLIPDAKQPIVFVRTRAIHLSGKAGIDHLEIEHRELRWFGRLRWRRGQQHEQ